MGCWNGTCQVSNLSISRGTPVVIIPIVLMDSKWKPCWFPIHGTYDEYGGIENIEENPMTDLILKTVMEKTKFSESISKDKFGSEVGIPPQNAWFWLGPQVKYADVDNKIPDNIEDLIRVMERQGCRRDVFSVRRYDGTWMPLSLCMVRKDVYEYMSRIDDNEFHSIFFKDNYDKIKEMLCTENLDIYKTIDKYPDLKIPTHDVMDSFRYILNNENYHSIEPINFGIITEFPFEVRKTFFDIWDKFYKFIIVFNKMRKTWSLPSNAGSQDGNIKLTMEFNNFVNKICEDIINNEEQEEDI
jgi:hypothetical protein